MSVQPMPTRGRSVLSFPLMRGSLTRSSCNRATVGLPSSQQSSLSSGIKGHQMILRKWFSGVPSGCWMWTKISSLSRVLRANQVDNEMYLAASDAPTFLQSPIQLQKRILNFAIN